METHPAPIPLPLFSYPPQLPLGWDQTPPFRWLWEAFIISCSKHMSWYVYMEHINTIPLIRDWFKNSRWSRSAYEITEGYYWPIVRGEVFSLSMWTRKHVALVIADSHFTTIQNWWVGQNWCTKESRARRSRTTEWKPWSRPTWSPLTLDTLLCKVIHFLVG